MYREYRDLTVGGAVTQCYRDMGARHRARAHSIQVINLSISDCVLKDELEGLLNLYRPSFNINSINIQFVLIFILMWLTQC